MSSLVTRFVASSGPILLRMEVFFHEDFGFIQMLQEGDYTACPPKELPLNVWMRCLYRFNRVVSQMIKPVDDEIEGNQVV